MNRSPFALAVILAVSFAGCASRQFVREEITRGESAVRPAVDRAARDLERSQIETRVIAAQVRDVRRQGDEAIRGSIEALGLADVSAGRAADAVDHATIALARADEALAAAEQALVKVDETAERLVRLWRGQGKRSVVESIVLRFRVDEWALDDQARVTLLDVTRRLRENPALVVELEGYADSVGASPYNLRLSPLRAEAVGRFLAEQGVETHRLDAIGLGAARPVADNATADGRRQNRRVVLRLLDPN
jgi:outer membrane protein OmpA-like peptidoglycan-associated protein